jgi:hypothetical protein
MISRGTGIKNWRDQTALLHDLKGMAITIPSSIFFDIIREFIEG